MILSPVSHGSVGLEVTLLGFVQLVYNPLEISVVQKKVIPQTNTWSQSFLMFLHCCYCLLSQHASSFLEAGLSDSVILF